MNYRDKLYSKYISTHTFHLYGEVTSEKVKKQFIAWNKYFGDFLPKNKDAKIIDLGCGNGSFLLWLKEKGYSNIEGIDISKEQVEDAKKLGLENVYLADALEFLKNKSECYDLMVARDLLEHLNKEEVLDFLELIFKSVKIGGHLIIQTSNAESPFCGKYRYGDFTHELSFTVNSLKQISYATGFNEIIFRPQKPVVHGLKSMIRLFLWEAIEFFLRIYLLAGTGQKGEILTQSIMAVLKK